MVATATTTATAAGIRMAIAPAQPNSPTQCRLLMALSTKAATTTRHDTSHIVTIIIIIIIIIIVVVVVVVVVIIITPHHRTIKVRSKTHNLYRLTPLRGTP
jgi:heme/copper-type cytochrome/quinol oxidase subunit 2